MRKKIIIGNWKMNMLPNDTMKFIEELSKEIKNEEVEVVICVPYIDLFYALLSVQGTNIKIGAQNVHWDKKGAYTGEISAQMLSCLGVEYVIIGHSERRQYYLETNDIINKKIKAAIAEGLIPIVCVGENLQEREKGNTRQIIINQIKEILKDVTKEEMKKIVIAYEPVWAIGTGKTATSEEANDVIKLIREKVLELYDREISENMIIQYGGSIKSSNAKELFEMSDIDGGLIGGASLNVEEFSKIINYK